MVYVLVLFCIALLFKKASKEIIWCNLILIVIFYSTQLFFYNRCHFGKSPIGETLCVPINQMAYVYVNRDNLSNEEKEKIIFYIPEAQNYNPRFIDPVKGCFNQEGYNISKNEFWKLYLSLLKKYPFDYIKAFLNTNLPYWFVKAEIPDHYSQRAYIETYNLYPDKNEFPILRRQNYLKSLNDYYESIANFNNRVLKIFPFSLLFSLSFPFLSLIVCLYLSIKLNICDLIWIYILYLLLLFTYILGPVSNFRYVYTYYLCLPFYFGIIFRRIKEKK